MALVIGQDFRGVSYRTDECDPLVSPQFFDAASLFIDRSGLRLIGRGQISEFLLSLLNSAR
ncbi:MAG: hypothetical protein A3E78_15575 [Alphaproteobacteria bacterium RIFCSPHIGHO2_12_FULL_63_12]|nr:MAG: hypothetical protein A3E78_15575 [Alphaproteobacteria bacterium RIFCSPHIGHO2_12_FULL_63_12]